MSIATPINTANPTMPAQSEAQNHSHNDVQPSRMPPHTLAPSPNDRPACQAQVTAVTVRAGERYEEAMKILREAADATEIVRKTPRHRELSDNDVSPGSGSVFPGGE